MAEYVVEFGKDWPAGRSRRSISTRRRFTATIARSARCCSHSLAGKSGDVVEAGSGTGQHVVDFASHLPEVTWWPSDLNEQHLKSILAWRAHAGLANIRSPLRIDLSDPEWCPEMHNGSGPANLLAVFCANVIHIAPWRVAEGLFAGAGRYLQTGGGCSSMGRSSAAASIPRPAMPRSIKPARPERRMGRARYRRCPETRGKRRPQACRQIRRDARQQPDPGVRAIEAVFLT